jgi:hypothetical protein
MKLEINENNNNFIYILRLKFKGKDFVDYD